MISTAILSDDKIYRYQLARIWNDDLPALLFIMLNPSTADASVDDPTIRRCMNFAATNRYGGIYVCNLFAYRATNPKELTDVLGLKPTFDIVGPENDRHIFETLNLCKDVVFAWGNYGGINGRDWDILQKVGAIKAPLCLGRTMFGSPKHPLYLPKNSPLIKYV